MSPTDAPRRRGTYTDREGNEQSFDLDATFETVARKHNELVRAVRLALALAACAVLGVVLLLVFGGDDRERPAAAKPTKPAEAAAEPRKPAPAPDGRRVEMTRVQKTADVRGVATLRRASTKSNVKLQLELDLDGGRGTVLLRPGAGRARYVYDLLGSGTQTSTWARSTLRRYRTLVVVGRQGAAQRTVLAVPVYKLLGGKKPATRKVRRVPVNPDAETNLHRLLLERTRGAKRDACYVRRGDRPATATAQWACTVEGVKVRYLRFRTSAGMRKYARWLMANTAPQSTRNTPTCPDGTVSWERTNRGRAAAGTVRLRRRTSGGLLLVMTYPSRKSLAVAGTATAKNPVRVCNVWWKAA